MFGQAAAYSDPAQAYLKLLLDKDATTYIRIESFKVSGTPYLFGEKHSGDFYSPNGVNRNVFISYNTYYQQIELCENSESKPVIKQCLDVDSFQIKKNELVADLKFINGKILGSSEKCFFQVIALGSKYSLYKKYNSTLGYVSTNYVQSELRQFDLTYDYYYADNISKTIKKLKLNVSSLDKEFKKVKDISSQIDSDALTNNPEVVLYNLIVFLNQ